MSEVVRESVASYGGPLRLMSVREFYLAADKGVFDADEKLELIRGEVVQLSPQKSAHAWATDNLGEVLGEVFPGANVRKQFPLRLDDFNEPEPDVVVAKGPRSLYMHRHPSAADVLLVVEVADTSVRKDRSLKAPLYAEFGIAEYWILDLQANRLEVYRMPVADADGKIRYSSVEVFGEDALVLPINAEGGKIAVHDLLPV